VNFQLPQQDDDFDYYGNSSQDESRGSQGRHYFNIFFLFIWDTVTWIFTIVDITVWLVSGCIVCGFEVGTW